MFSHIILGKMSSIQLYKPVTRWVDNWLMGWAQCYNKWGYIGLVAVSSGASQAQLFIDHLGPRTECALSLPVVLQWRSCGPP